MAEVALIAPLTHPEIYTEWEDRMPRKPTWQVGHAHDHTNRYPEHEHGENPTEESLKSEHDALFPGDDFDQGPEANRSMHGDVEACPVNHGRGFRCEHLGGIGHDENHFMEADDEAGTPRLEWDGPDQNDNKAEPLTARGNPSNGQVAQTGFGDIVISIEEEEGEKFLALLDERAEIKVLAARYNTVNADIKKQLTTRGLNTGTAARIRVAAHILNLSDKSEDKAVDAKTRAGSRRLSIVHPE